MKAASGEVNVSMVAAMMTPAVMVSTAPSAMMAPATATHMVAVAVPTFDLNNRVVLRSQWSDTHPGGSGCGHGQQQRATNQCNASHAVRPPIAWIAICAYNFPEIYLFHMSGNAYRY
jgi:hypothetical protein